VSQRTQRIGDQIQREIASLIRLEIKDPRVGMVTVSSVKVSPDMGYADVYITVLGATLEAATDENQAATLAVLNGASGFLRNQLGKALQVRMTPRLRFHIDEVTARGNRMATLINEAVKQDQSRAVARGDVGDDVAESGVDN
jgi:ribosome-binding factor A